MYICGILMIGRTKRAFDLEHTSHTAKERQARATKWVIEIIFTMYKNIYVERKNINIKYFNILYMLKNYY